MSNEIGLHVEKTLVGTPYAIIRNSINQVWDVTNTQFATYVPANLGDYDIPMTQQGAIASSFWIASFPVHNNMIPGVYNIQIYDDSGGIAEGNPHLGVLDDFEWDASVEVDPNLIHFELSFNIDDPNLRDEYTVYFKKNGIEITSAAAFTGSDPDINVKDNLDADLIAQTVMTQIGATQRWKYDATLLERITDGGTYVVDIIAEIYGTPVTFSETIFRDD